MRPAAGRAVKVLLAPLGSRGDVQPQLVLAAELQRRGHDVTLATTPDFKDWIEQRGFRYVAAGTSVTESLQRHRNMTEQHPALALPGQLRLVREHTRLSAAGLLAARLEADLVVSAGLSFAGKLLADKLRVPHVFCTYSQSVVYSGDYPPAALPIFGLPRSANRALWGAMSAALDLTVMGVLNDARRSLGLGAHRGSWMKLIASQLMLAQDEVLGELPRDVRGQATQVPALVPASQSVRPLSDLLERFLRGASDGPSDASPIVYLGFGSMPSVDRAQLRQVARELFERHGARVVLCSSELESEGADMPPGVFVTGDTEHPALFPRVDLIVHHGGAGTTAAALRSGVPQLVVPHILDQFFHGQRIAQLGIGPAPLAKNALTAAAIASALKNRFEYWGAAQSARAKVAPEGGAKPAADYLERLVAHRGA